MNRRVDVDVGDAALRESLVQCLQGLGLQSDHPGGGGAPAAILRDSPRDEQQVRVPIVRVCLGREPKAWPPVGNPFDNPRVHHYVSCKPEPDPREIASALRQIFEGGRIDFEELIAPNADVYTAKEAESSRREHHTWVLRQFLARPHVPDYVRQNAERVFEELFTNAVYDAPRDARGAPRHAHLPRSVSVTSQRPFEIRFAVDEHAVCVAVRDAYGALDPARVLFRLHECFNPRGAAVENKYGGAGLGLFLTLQGCSRMIINLSPGTFTEVITQHRLFRRRRDFQASTMALSICVARGAAAAI